MKIAILTPTFPPYGGGIGMVAYHNARELARHGHSVTVLTPRYARITQAVSDMDGFDIRWVATRYENGNAAVLKNILKEVEGFDVVHLHYPFFGVAEIIRLRFSKLRKRGQKVILHYHMDPIGTGWRNVIFQFSQRYILPGLCRMVDRVIVTSLDYAQASDIGQLMQRSPDKFIAVPNGVSLTDFQPKNNVAELRKRYAIDENTAVFLFVGGLDTAHYFKGVEYLLEAAQYIKRSNTAWKLLIVGSGDLQQKYESLAHQLHLKERVIFAGHVDQQELAAHYSLATATVLPSISMSEAFGMVLIESFACGTGVIATNLPGVRSVVIDDVGLLVEPRSTEQLAGALQYVLSHPEEVEQWGTRGVDYVAKKYSWDTIGQQLDTLIRSL